jgi:hypothetical protein
VPEVIGMGKELVRASRLKSPSPGLRGRGNRELLMNVEAPREQLPSCRPANGVSLVLLARLPRSDQNMPPWRMGSRSTKSGREREGEGRRRVKKRSEEKRSCSQRNLCFALGMNGPFRYCSGQHVNWEVLITLPHRQPCGKAGARSAILGKWSR